MTKTGLKAVLKEYFGVTPQSINSLRMDGKVKRFRGRLGQRNDYKNFMLSYQKVLARKYGGLRWQLKLINHILQVEDILQV